MSRKAGNKLPSYAVQYPRRGQILFTPRRKPDITYYLSADHVNN